MVLVGTMGGATLEVDLGALMGKRLQVRGTTLRARPQEEKVALTQAFARRWLPLFASGRLRPVIDRVFPLEAVADAHRLMESNANFGKIVLRHAP
jgi:NADPH:quinone reductase-like Zn-dependent oxidoreductase